MKTKDIEMSCENTLHRPYGSITKEYIKEVVEYVFREPPKKVSERVVKFTTYCKGRNGPMCFSSEEWSPCNHPDCFTCRGMETAFKKEFEEQVEKWISTPLDKAHLKDSFTSVEFLTEEEIKKRYGGLL